MSASPSPQVSLPAAVPTPTVTVSMTVAPVTSQLPPTEQVAWPGVLVQAAAALFTLIAVIAAVLAARRSAADARDARLAQARADDRAIEVTERIAREEHVRFRRNLARELAIRHAIHVSSRLDHHEDDEDLNPGHHTSAADIVIENRSEREIYVSSLEFYDTDLITGQRHSEASDTYPLQNRVVEANATWSNTLAGTLAGHWAEREGVDVGIVFLDGEFNQWRQKPSGSLYLLNLRLIDAITD